MEVEVTNPANSPMHYGDYPVVGIIKPPDALPNRILYTNAEANRVYNDIQYDIYQTQKEHDRIIKKPKNWSTFFKIVVGAALATLAIVYRKNIAQFFKSAFQKIKGWFTKKP